MLFLVGDRKPHGNADVRIDHAAAARAAFVAARAKAEPARNLAAVAGRLARRALDLAMRSPALDAPHAPVAAWRVAAANLRHRIAPRPARALHEPRYHLSPQCPNHSACAQYLGGPHPIREHHHHTPPP